MSYRYNKRIKYLTTNHGLSFLEVMMVVAIIGIISSMCIYAYFGLLAKQRVKNITRQMETIVIAVKDFRTRNPGFVAQGVSQLPDTNSINLQYDMSLESDFFVLSMDFTNPNVPVITATLDKDISVGIKTTLKKTDNLTLTYTIRNTTGDPWGGSAQLLSLR